MGRVSDQFQQLLLPASPESLPYNSTKSTLQQAILHVVTDAQAASPHAAPQQACLAAPHMLTTLLLSQSYPNTLTDPTPLELRPHPTRMCSDRLCFPVRFHCAKAQKVVGQKQRVFVLSRTHKRDNPSPTTRDPAHKRRVATAHHALRTKRAHTPRGQAAHACKSVARDRDATTKLEVRSQSRRDSARRGAQWHDGCRPRRHGSHRCSRTGRAQKRAWHPKAPHIVCACQPGQAKIGRPRAAKRASDAATREHTGAPSTHPQRGVVQTQSRRL